MRLACGDKALDLSGAVVMGVLNVTPDSFSDGGSYLDPERALDRALEMVEEGAAIIDLGGESTRPGALEVSAVDEVRRVIPVLERLVSKMPVPISVDTSKPVVMKAALIAGAGMINDICALSEPGALHELAGSNAAVCLMHMQGRPRDMQLSPCYEDVVTDVCRYLESRVCECIAQGISREQIVLDPGFGFGKSVENNYSLLKHLSVFVDLGMPVLAGMSRKSMIGAVLNVPVVERMVGSVAAALLAVQAGAKIVRVHDVLPTVQALKVWETVQRAG